MRESSLAVVKDRGLYLEFHLFFLTLSSRTPLQGFCLVLVFFHESLSIYDVLALLASVSCSICRNTSVSLILFHNTTCMSWFHFCSSMIIWRCVPFAAVCLNVKLVLQSDFFLSLLYIMTELLHVRKYARSYSQLRWLINIRSSIFNSN